MKSLTRYLKDLRELVREKVQILSEHDRIERRYDESVRRRYSKGRGEEPVIRRGQGFETPEREK
jgi:hypothetical protein